MRRNNPFDRIEEVVKDMNRHSRVVFGEGTLLQLKKDKNESLTYICSGNVLDDYFGLAIKVSFYFDNGNLFCQFFSLECCDLFRRVLFRAEFLNSDLTHPQPHWHFYNCEPLNQIDRNSFEDQIISQDTLNCVDVSKMHFAMSKIWHNDKNDISSIPDASQLGEWYGKLLTHIKEQLNHLLEKSKINVYT